MIENRRGCLMGQAADELLKQPKQLRDIVDGKLRPQTEEEKRKEEERRGRDPKLTSSTARG